jgi:tetratricopeptide (TPR) repeat protein
MIPHHELTLVTFGRWEDALRAPAPPADLPVATGLHHYARGTALAATGRGAEAARELALVQAELAKIPAADVDARRILEIAQHSLQGEMALRGGKAEAAVAHYEAAAKVEDQILYNEPPLWYYPVRESLGQAYLAAGRPADAERAYQRDLGLFPGNVWSAYGLLQAQRAQGKWADAAATDALYRKAAAKADVTLTGSRF